MKQTSANRTALSTWSQSCQLACIPQASVRRPMSAPKVKHASSDTNVTTACFRSPLKLSSVFIHCQRLFILADSSHLKLLPDFAAKVLQSRHAPHLQIHEGALHHLQLPARHQPASGSADTAPSSAVQHGLQAQHTLSVIAEVMSKAISSMPVHHVCLA